jgi:AraC-like DNA-binding protein
MLPPDFLALELVRLKSPGEWMPRGESLSFLIVKGGAGKFTVGLETHTLALGDVLVCNGGGGKVCVGHAPEVAFWCFTLSLERLFPLFATNEIPMLHNVVKGLQGIKRYQASSAIAAECHRLIPDIAPRSSLVHRAQLLRIAAAIFSEEFEAESRRPGGLAGGKNHFIETFEGLSADDLLRLSVAELAARFGCGRRHLNRIFHQHFGFSVAAMRMEMRMLKAASLLRDPASKVTNVAEQCGFNYLGLFIACFKKRFGASPGQWRMLDKASDPRAKQGRGPVAAYRLGVTKQYPWIVGPEPQPAPPRRQAADHQGSGAARASIGSKHAKPGPREKLTRGNLGTYLASTENKLQINP